jgi:uncharacterized protein (TIGR00251 family)
MAHKYDGRIMKVKVIPRSSRNSIEEIDIDRYVMRITVAPEHGKANVAVVKMLARQLQVAPSLLELCSGARSRNKVFVIR